MTENDIAKVLLGELDAATALARITLEEAAKRQIICPVTHTLLDVRKAVAFELKRGNVRSLDVMSADHWDTVAEVTIETARENNVEITVYDGRKLFGEGK